MLGSFVDLVDVFIRIDFPAADGARSLSVSEEWIEERISSGMRRLSGRCTVLPVEV